MPASPLSAVPHRPTGRWWPEALVALFAAVMFLGSLGSVEFWGKREQRASLEAVDTLENQHWLVARIQGHPRLEKPPLSRWLIASLMAATGRRDEWVVRLPVALSALAMVGLVYALGKRLDGRSTGLAAAMILCSTGFFIAEMRQAGNDGLLALCTTLALYAAWRRLEPGLRGWNFLFYAALGLGILAKGPIVLLLVGVTVIPYLAVAGRLREGLWILVDGPGMLLCSALGLAWPILVVLDDPQALGVWTLEMKEKTGLGQMLEHHRHSFLAGEWPQMVLPWPILGILAVALPFLRTNVVDPTEVSILKAKTASRFWFPWFWGIGNLAMFCLWTVAKPSYYLPCLPGMALLLGAAWVRLTQMARKLGQEGALARQVLQLQWVMLFVAAGFTPVVTRAAIAPSVWPWMNFLAITLAAGVIASTLLWRRGADALALAPLTGACALIVLIGYGIIAPADNPQRGHRELAHTLDRLVNPDNARVLFLQEIDEGLSFHFQSRSLEPLPGSQRRYNAAYDLADDYKHGRRPRLSRKEVEITVTEELKTSLVDWLDRSASTSDFLLVPATFYDRFAKELAPRTTPVFREEAAKKRNQMTLLRVGKSEPKPLASIPSSPGRSPSIGRY